MPKQGFVARIHTPLACFFARLQFVARRERIIGSGLLSLVNLDWQRPWQQGNRATDKAQHHTDWDWDWKANWGMPLLPFLDAALDAL
ncbi:hypothetical protein PG997_001143 [Apiospora hydei]|uniref:Uncharacterized protein n=1 Tax=Apiospora hydei TaxID=1337664 RepID=A0ABR1XCX6_9PEZI